MVARSTSASWISSRAAPASSLPSPSELDICVEARKLTSYGASMFKQNGRRDLGVVLPGLAGAAGVSGGVVQVVDDSGDERCFLVGIAFPVVGIGGGKLRFDRRVFVSEHRIGAKRIAEPELLIPSGGANGHQVQVREPMLLIGRHLGEEPTPRPAVQLGRYIPPVQRVQRVARLFDDQVG